MATPAVRIPVSGARGESYADILRRTGLFGVLPGDDDETAISKLNADTLELVEAAELARDQAADLVLPENIFVEADLATAEVAGEAGTSNGTYFKAVGTAEGEAQVRVRTVSGSDLLYTELTKAALESTDADKGVNFIGNAVLPVANRSVLALANSTRHPLAYLKEAGRVGLFQWSGDDHSAGVTADPAQGIYVAPDGDATGASGAWVRQWTDTIRADWFGAVGDDTTDCRVALNRCFSMGTWLAAQAGGGRTHVVIPPGIYKVVCIGDNGTLPLDQDGLLPTANLFIENQGVLKSYGTVPGGFIIYRYDNVTMWGGEFDGNELVNNNIHAISAIKIDQSGFFVNAPPENIRILHTSNYRARHGGAHLPDNTDPANVGRGGGKVFTGQIGAIGCWFSHNTVVDCDLGISIEGIEQFSGSPTDKGYSHTIQIEGNTIMDCRYMAFYLSGTPTTVSLYGTVTQALIANNIVRNCGNGQTLEGSPHDVSDYFGVITVNGGAQYSVKNLIVVNTSGKTTLVRGSSNTCGWNIDATIGGQLVDGINSAPYGGYAPKNGTSPYGTSEIVLQMLGASVLSGYLLNNHATYYSRNNTVKFIISHLGNGTPAEVPTAQYVNNLQSSNTVEVHDQHSGRTTTFQKGAANDNVGGGTSVNDDAVMQIKLVRTNGTLQITASTGGTIASCTLWFDGEGTNAAIITQSGSDFTVTVDGVPTGTTGTDAKYNVYFDDTTRSVYIENRIGAARTMWGQEALAA